MILFLNEVTFWDSGRNMNLGEDTIQLSTLFLPKDGKIPKAITGTY